MIAIAVTEAIRELGSIPSGRLYAQLMARMTLDVYNLVIESIKKTGAIEEKNHVLIWAGKY